MKWEDIEWTFGGGTSQDKKIHDEAMEQIEYWNEKILNALSGDNISNAIQKKKDDLKKLKTFMNLHEPPENSPPIEDVYDFEGTKYDFASKHSKIWNNNKNNDDWKWATTRMKYFRWLQFQWTIKGKKFTAEELQTSLTTADDMNRI